MGLFQYLSLHNKPHTSLIALKTSLLVHGSAIWAGLKEITCVCFTQHQPGWLKGLGKNHLKATCPAWVPGLEDKDLGLEGWAAQAPLVRLLCPHGVSSVVAFYLQHGISSVVAFCLQHGVSSVVAFGWLDIFHVNLGFPRLLYCLEWGDTVSPFMTQPWKHTASLPPHSTRQNQVSETSPQTQEGKLEPIFSEEHQRVSKHFLKPQELST